MRRLAVVALFVAGCAVSAAAGFWLGFGEGWTTGVEAENVPRGALAAQHLTALRDGKMQSVLIGLEFEVDRGLTWGNALFNHPMRELWRPLWGLDVYPDYERYAVRMADYRQRHPSLLREEAFGGGRTSGEQPDEVSRQFSRGAQDSRTTIDAMVRRYATKPRE